jgi:hypothetical protein
MIRTGKMKKHILHNIFTFPLNRRSAGSLHPDKRQLFASLPKILIFAIIMLIMIMVSSPIWANPLDKTTRQIYLKQNPGMPYFCDNTWGIIPPMPTPIVNRYAIMKRCFPKSSIQQKYLNQQFFPRNNILFNYRYPFRSSDPLDFSDSSSPFSGQAKLPWTRTRHRSSCPPLFYSTRLKYSAFKNPVYFPQLLSLELLI